MQLNEFGFARPWIGQWGKGCFADAEEISEVVLQMHRHPTGIQRERLEVSREPATRQVMKTHPTPAGSKFTVLRQRCNDIPPHLVPKVARDTAVDKQARIATHQRRRREPLLQSGSH